MYNQAPNLSLTISKVDDVTYTGQISDIWTTAVNLMRIGYKIVTDDGQSQGIVTAIRTTTVTIQSVTGFKSQTYRAGTWQLYVPTVTDLQMFLPELLENTKFIPQLLAALQNQVDEVDDSVLRLNYSKDYNKTSNELLAQTLSDIGIEFYRDVDYDTLRKLVQESVNYEILSGRKIGLDYIGISLGIELRYEQLWTSDYLNFYTHDEIPNSELDGFYPTNYVRIYYDNLGKDIDTEVIVDMFYQLAWVCNIIYDIINTYRFDSYLEYINTGILPASFVFFKNKNAEMEGRIEDNYLDEVPMPAKFSLS